MLIKGIKGILNKRILLGGIVLSVLWGCTDSIVLDPIAYVKWVKNPANGLQQDKAVGAYVFSAQYKPLPYIVAQEERKEELEKVVLEKRVTTLGDHFHYFNLKIKSKEGNLSPTGNGALSDRMYQQRLSYFTLDMQRDLYLVQKKDTLPCSLYQFVRNYDVAPYVNFTIGFESPTKIDFEEDLTLILEDKVLGSGTLKFLFDQSSLQRIPKIKTR
jgi:hypothetical protein